MVALATLVSFLLILAMCGAIIILDRIFPRIQAPNHASGLLHGSAVGEVGSIGTSPYSDLRLLCRSKPMPKRSSVTNISRLLNISWRRILRI